MKITSLLSKLGGTSLGFMMGVVLTPFAAIGKVVSEERESYLVDKLYEVEQGRLKNFDDFYLSGIVRRIIRFPIFAIVWTAGSFLYYPFRGAYLGFENGLNKDIVWNIGKEFFTYDVKEVNEYNVNKIPEKLQWGVSYRAVLFSDNTHYRAFYEETEKNKDEKKSPEPESRAISQNDIPNRQRSPLSTIQKEQSIATRFLNIFRSKEESQKRANTKQAAWQQIFIELRSNTASPDTIKYAMQHKEALVEIILALPADEKLMALAHACIPSDPPNQLYQVMMAQRGLQKTSHASGNLKKCYEELNKALIQQCLQQKSKTKQSVFDLMSEEKNASGVSKLLMQLQTWLDAKTLTPQQICWLFLGKTAPNNAGKMSGFIFSQQRPEEQKQYISLLRDLLVHQANQKDILNELKLLTESTSIKVLTNLIQTLSQTAFAENEGRLFANVRNHAIVNLIKQTKPETINELFVTLTPLVHSKQLNAEHAKEILALLPQLSKETCLLIYNSAIDPQCPWHEYFLTDGYLQTMQQYLLKLGATYVAPITTMASVAEVDRSLYPDLLGAGSQEIDNEKLKNQEDQLAEMFAVIRKWEDWRTTKTSTTAAVQEELNKDIGLKETSEQPDSMPLTRDRFFQELASLKVPTAPLEDEPTSNEKNSIQEKKYRKPWVIKSK